MSETAGRGSQGIEDQELLRDLLVACREIAATGARLSNQLRALLLLGDARDRSIARGRLGDAVVADLLRRPEPQEGTIERIVRETEIRRLATAVGDARAELGVKHERLRALVNTMAPGLTAQHRVGPIRAAEIILGG